MRLKILIEDDNNENENIESNNYNDTKDLKELCSAVGRIYDNSEVFRKNLKRIIKVLHPFDLMKVEVHSDLLKQSSVKITNAFMKMYEMLKYVDKYLKEDVITMFDIAGAPGMFVIAADYYFKRRNKKLEWNACSLVDENSTALTDSYGLYKENPERFTAVDLTNPKDLKKVINKRAKLVTGDVGMEHGYDELQEYAHLDVQYGQAVLGLNVCEEGGVMILKMYTVTAPETHYLIDTIRKYFERTYIVKPFTSRLLNTETYIIAFNRNSLDASTLPLTRPSMSSYISPAKTSYYMFEQLRSTERILYANTMIKLFHKYHSKLSYKYLMKDVLYCNFINILIHDLSKLFSEFMEEGLKDVIKDRLQ